VLKAPRSASNLTTGDVSQRFTGGAVTNSPSNPVQPERYLETLVTDYTVLREDRQSMDQVVAALISVAVALIGGLGAFLARTCKGTSLSCSPQIWPPIYGILPLVPLAVLAQFGSLANVHTIRSYYTRAVEEQLQMLASSPEIRYRDSAPIRLPNFSQLVDRMVSQRRGRGFLRYQFLVLVMYLTIGVLFIGVTIWCLFLTRPLWFRIAMGLFYALSLAVLIRVLWAGTVGGHALWKDLTRHYSGQSTEEQELRRHRQGRSLSSYLLLPRPGELLVKGGIIPLAWALSSLATGEFRIKHVWQVILLTLIFEVVFYQARYVINDLHGLRIDSRYSKFKKQIRFPQPARRIDVQISILTVAGRVILAILLAASLLDPRLQQAIVVAGGAVFLHSAAYELLRHKVSPNKPGHDLLRMTIGRMSILTLVGVGYAIRACLGLFLGDDGNTDWLLLGYAALMMTALGSMFVAMTWAIDGITQVVPHDARDATRLLAMSLGSSERPSSFSERPLTHRYRKSLEEMSHIAPLLQQAELLDKRSGVIRATSAPAPANNEDDLLRTRRSLEQISGLTWWNTMLVIAAVLAGLTGVRLAGSHHVGSMLTSGAIGLIGGALIVIAYGGDRRLFKRWGMLSTPSQARALAPLLIFAIGLTLVGGNVPPQPDWLAGIPFAVVGGVYLFFRHASLQDIQVQPSMHRS
jgi:hypothetical protein